MTQAIIAVHGITSGAITSIVEYFKELRAEMRLNSKIRQTVKELNQLTDRELNDIGIARGDIYMVARGDETHRRSMKAELNANLKGWV